MDADIKTGIRFLRRFYTVLQILLFMKAHCAVCVRILGAGHDYPDSVPLQHFL
ncbi:MAG: hypothetical protein J6C26_03450 [Clostridia bacterium]|nr:hypothetical protein [Clostridia bacterium]